MNFYDPTTLLASMLIGLLIGSFLNVCIYRVPRKLSVVSPARSYCPQCNRSLSWWENVPVVSWLLLGARCRGCKKPISGQYPLVELLSALSAVIVVLQFGITPTGVVMYALVCSLIVISFIDLEFRIIPNVISFPGMTFGLVLGIISQYTPYFRCAPEAAFCPITQSALDSLLGWFFGAGVFVVIGELYFRATKRVGLGFGDVKLMGMTGAILGWKSVFPTIFVGALLGSVVGIAVMLIRSSGRHTEIPFGPWLSLGAILYLLQFSQSWTIHF